MQDKTAAKAVIDAAPKMEKPITPGQAGFNTESVTGIYRIAYYIYAPENPSGRGVVRITLPNLKEYKRVRRQINRKKKCIKWYDEHGEPNLILISPNTLFVSPEKFEVTKVAGDNGKKQSRIILPSQEAISSIK